MRPERASGRKALVRNRDRSSGAIAIARVAAGSTAAGGVAVDAGITAAGALAVAVADPDVVGVGLGNAGLGTVTNTVVRTRASGVDAAGTESSIVSGNVTQVRSGIGDAHICRSGIVVLGIAGGGVAAGGVAANRGIASASSLAAGVVYANVIGVLGRNLSTVAVANSVVRMRAGVTDAIIGVIARTGIGCTENGVAVAATRTGTGTAVTNVYTCRGRIVVLGVTRGSVPARGVAANPS